MRKSNIKALALFVIALALIFVGVVIGTKTTVAHAPEPEEGMFPGWFQAKDDPVFQAIAVCESNNNPLAKNPHSSASGRFQFINSTWDMVTKKYGTEHYDRFDWNNNTEMAWYLYDHGRGARHWECYTEGMI